MNALFISCDIDIVRRPSRQVLSLSGATAVGNTMTGKVSVSDGAPGSRFPRFLGREPGTKYGTNGVGFGMFEFLRELDKLFKNILISENRGVRRFK